MSFSFTISPATNVRFKALDTALRTEFGDILTWENEPPSPWPLYFYTHVHLWGISTRSVELGPSNDGFEVRIMACSCVEDHELALRIVELIAQMTGGAIEPESGESVTAETLRHRFDKEWVDEAVNSSATFLPKVVEHDTTQGPLTMSGPGRDSYWVSG